ncbi:MAG: wax ester/triacylglycerol synthase family O-acyltransferase [Rubrivivax sp.]|nr:wax ester/triacylglycerol synthase family O-acyltransferase [Rubrivivax sp.]
MHSTTTQVRMKQLSGLDATFLYLETPQMPMHVGALNVFELPPGYKGKFVTALRRHMQQRLVLTPALRRRLWWMPLNLANPAWVDAEPDLTQHIVEIRLPKGAGLPQLEDEVARLHPVLLDRRRPLWKFHVFEGLAPSPEGRRRVALYSQLHHAAVDGQAAVALANAIMDIAPEGRRVDARPSSRQKTFRLEMTEMLRGVIANQAQKVAQIVKELPSTVGTLKDAASRAAAGSALLGGGAKGGRPSNLTLAPRTPLNVSVTEGRAFAAVTLPLPELKALGKAHEATINDMVLMVCGTALRRYLAKKRLLPRKSLIAAVPITLRAQGDTTSDNQASMSFISLGTHIADPLKRLAHVKAASRAMKDTMGPLKDILPTDFPSMGVPWLMEAVTALYGRSGLADRIPQVANVVISNVPGPPVPLYMAGARMLTNYPTSIIVHGMALNITVQSYDQSLDFGLIADLAAMPDVRDLGEAMRIAFDDIRALPLPGDPHHDDTPQAADLVKQASRQVGKVIGDAMGKVTKSVVGSAVDAAIAGVRGTRRAAAPARKRR